MATPEKWHQMNKLATPSFFLQLFEKLELYGSEEDELYKQCYDWAVQSMMRQNTEEFALKLRNILAGSIKNIVASHRATLARLSWWLENQRSNERLVISEHYDSYRNIVRAECNAFCVECSGFIQQHIMNKFPREGHEEDEIFYNRLLGDIYTWQCKINTLSKRSKYLLVHGFCRMRVSTETATIIPADILSVCFSMYGDHKTYRQEHAKQAQLHYENGRQMLDRLRGAHPTRYAILNFYRNRSSADSLCDFVNRIELVLNAGIFYKEIMDEEDKACSWMLEELCRAIEHLSMDSTYHYKESTVLMQRIRDKLVQWKDEKWCTEGIDKFMKL